jgi:hypothetical protein
MRQRDGRLYRDNLLHDEISAALDPQATHPSSCGLLAADTAGLTAPYFLRPAAIRTRASTARTPRSLRRGGDWTALSSGVVSDKTI